MVCTEAHPKSCYWPRIDIHILFKWGYSLRAVSRRVLSSITTTKGHQLIRQGGPQNEIRLQVQMSRKSEPAQRSGEGRRGSAAKVSGDQTPVNKVPPPPPSPRRNKAMISPNELGLPVRFPYKKKNHALLWAYFIMHYSSWDQDRYLRWIARCAGVNTGRWRLYRRLSIGLQWFGCAWSSLPSTYWWGQRLNEKGIYISNNAIENVRVDSGLGSSPPLE